MNDIDWSKAPEGATHFQPRNEEAEMPAFWRVVDGVARDVWCFDDSLEFLRHHFKYGPKGCIGFHPEKCLERPQEWTGEGLPPVGTVCEWRDEDAGCWHKVEVRYLSKHTALLHFPGDGDGDTEGAFAPNYCQFRPFRTPEQIAAEERKRVIDDMLIDATRPGSITWTDCCNALYDAGYRKTEAP